MLIRQQSKSQAPWLFLMYTLLYEPRIITVQTLNDLCTDLEQKMTMLPKCGIKNWF